MGDQSIRASRRHIRNIEQNKLLEDLLTAFDKNMPFNTVDALEVLVVMTTTLVTTHCHNRQSAENIMARVVARMDEIINEEPWATPETRKH
jgi:hypothetical protein